MQKEQGYKKYIVWQKADELAFKIYIIAKEFPREELYGITSQLRRAAISVPTNIAEGMGRQNRLETRQFVNISLGSICEVEYLLGFVFRLGFLDEKQYHSLDSLRKEVSNLLMGLFRSFSRTTIV